MRYNAISEKPPVTSHLAEKHPKLSKLSVSRILEKTVTFSITTHRDSTFAPHNNFANLGAFKNAFVLV